MAAPTRRTLAVASAPAVFVLLWSTGFIGAKYGLPYAEPFTFLALRLMIASALLWLIVAVTRSERPRTRVQWGRSAVTGVLLHAGYLGGVFWSIDNGLPSGVSAVIVSLQPVVVAALANRLLGERLSRWQWVGLVLGVIGVVLVLAPGLFDAGRSADFPILGIVACLVALAAGTAGTIHQKRHGDGIPLASGTAVQYLAAAALVAVLSLSFETQTIDWTLEFSLAMVWLVFALSLGAVLLLLFLLKRGSASGVSSLFYLVPPATAIEAYLLFGEDLALVSIIGVVVTAAGVALALRKPRADQPDSGTA
ncbi:MAG: DMT family transporter [Geodermatophilaceae bacterium]|nr:DMT family transporter [Geodermatophilaceae bacterium]